MAIKEKLVEVKHLLASGLVSDLNEIIADYLNNGWKLIDARFISFQSDTNEMKVFYLVTRDVG